MLHRELPNNRALSLYQIILTFNNPKDDGFGKHCGKKRESARNMHFLLFPLRFLFQQKEKLPFCNMHFVICKRFQFGHIKNFVVW